MVRKKKKKSCSIQYTNNTTVICSLPSKVQFDIYKHINIVDHDFFRIEFFHFLREKKENDPADADHPRLRDLHTAHVYSRYVL